MSIFALSGSIDPDTSMDEGDVFNTKTALNTLGHFKPPKHGLTRFPDQPMIDGVKSFQRANELRVDGVMKPGGPTAERVDQRLAEKQAKEVEEKRKKEQQRARLEAEMSVAHNNRNAAHERAMRKEREFFASARIEQRAWERVEAEGLKLGIQVSMTIITRRGRISSPGLAMAVDAWAKAKDGRESQQQELKALRNDVKVWDDEITALRNRLKRLS